MLSRQLSRDYCAGHMGRLRLFWGMLRGRDTILEATPMGIPVRISVRARREIRRVRAISKEAPLVQRMFEFLSDGDVIYDVGANIGLIALLLALHPSGRRSSAVHCFEPEPRNFRQLEGNIRANGLEDRVFTHRLALSDKSGEAELFIRGGPGEGRHSTVASEGASASIRIETETLSSFAGRTGRPPDLVKIDVEGAEGRVLEGMAPLLPDRGPRDLFIELHDKGEGELMPDGDTVASWLGGRGYRLAWEVERGRSRHQHYRRERSLS